MSVARALRALPATWQRATLQRHHEFRQRLVTDLLGQIDYARTYPEPPPTHFRTQARLWYAANVRYYRTPEAHEALYDALAGSDQCPDNCDNIGVEIEVTTTPPLIKVTVFADPAPEPDDEAEAA
jgi:hypothetical protein